MKALLLSVNIEYRKLLNKSSVANFSLIMAKNFKIDSHRKGVRRTYIRKFGNLTDQSSVIAK